MNVFRVEKCPACNSNSSKVVFTPDTAAWERFVLLSRRKYQGYMDEWQEVLDLEVRQCSSCGHFWHHTQPDFSSILGMYEAGVPLNEQKQERVLAPSAATFKSVLNLYKLSVRNNEEPPNFLDYGSGRGLWARAASEVGFRVWAYEPSVKRSKEGIGNFSLVHDLDELGGIRFDVINLEQVLEHTQMPFEVLKGLSCYLKLCSLVRVTVPNLTRAQGKHLWKEYPFDGDQMHIMSPYEHLQGFTITSLRTVLKRSGLIPARSFAVWKTHPVHSIRSVIGGWLPCLGTTCGLVHPACNPASAEIQG